jgi:hypothetical protein
MKLPAKHSVLLGHRSACPHCWAILDGATAVGTKNKIYPKEGDLTCCGYCFGVSRFGPEPELNLLPLTDEEFYALPEEFRTQLKKWST